MSKSPRKRDWTALLAQAKHADRQLSPEELDLWQRGVLDGIANGWHVEMLDALQRAIEGRDRGPLLRFLDEGMPFPGFMSPLLADAMRAIDGAPSKLTTLDDAGIADYYDLLIEHVDTKRGNRTRAKLRLAELKGVSVDLIERSLRRTGRI